MVREGLELYICKTCSQGSVNCAENLIQDVITPIIRTALQSLSQATGGLTASQYHRLARPQAGMLAQTAFIGDLNVGAKLHC